MCYRSWRATVNGDEIKAVFTHTHTHTHSLPLTLSLSLKKMTILNLNIISTKSISKKTKQCYWLARFNNINLLPNCCHKCRFHKCSSKHAGVFHEQRCLARGVAYVCTDFVCFRSIWEIRSFYKAGKIELIFGKQVCECPLMSASKQHNRFRRTAVFGVCYERHATNFILILRPYKWNISTNICT